MLLLGTALFSNQSFQYCLYVIFNNNKLSPKLSQNPPGRYTCHTIPTRQVTQGCQPCKLRAQQRAHTALRRAKWSPRHAFQRLPPGRGSWTWQVRGGRKTLPANSTPPWTVSIGCHRPRLPQHSLTPVKHQTAAETCGRNGRAALRSF